VDVLAEAKAQERFLTPKPWPKSKAFLNAPEAWQDARKNP